MVTGAVADTLCEFYRSMKIARTVPESLRSLQNTPNFLDGRILPYTTYPGEHSSCWKMKISSLFSFNGRILPCTTYPGNTGRTLDVLEDETITCLPSASSTTAA
ncbi:hypothetical protein Bbelb_067270 [Branchiostoma belcheri]|nr:hypothetical protein Bbelb_067270 [Branchiostoma belcheri]